MISPPGYITSIKPYVPGKPIEELERELGLKDSVKLASNENPAGPSPLAIEAIKNSTQGLNRYPDGNGYYLKNALSRKFSVMPENVILGNGSNEILEIAAKTFIRPGDEAVMAVPSFVVYSQVVQALDASPVQVPLNNGTLDLKAMAEAVSGKTRMVFIANPNNPTGTINKKDEFDWFMEKLPDGILTVVDEAYCEYVSDPEYADAMKHFRKGKDVLILRTFSKIYGLAGLRMGYGFAQSGIITEMNKIRQPFNTGSIAQNAALSALGDSEHIRRSIDCNEKGKAYLYQEFEKLGLDYTPTEANFIYVRMRNPLELYERLLKKGIIIRQIGPDAVRITIGLQGENERFIEALKTTLGEGF